ncbi:NUDIX hydrolase [Shimia sp. R11_0]|uniref:NUDIX domain protein n=1 Tax=Shimia marina TaxID=321267 RepID=A0A0P1EQC3_9RHOB|nr:MULTISPECIES: NUDIX hydrolase [Shimia]MBO9475913.1 NUDIX hydrolase [Shimia sp. R11_0]CUH52657.1 NUDIX domain protein [Shimia marina]SFE67624.1 8-oxo-dGTP diphosphatase [Shimia marina]
MTIAFHTLPDRAYRGAKLILFVGDKLVTVLRDDKPDIPWPAYWDFPGGGREGNESGLCCALRETREEIGLNLSEGDVVWARRYQRHDHFTWFFAAQLPASAAQRIVLGDEGQRWTLMSPQVYLTHPRGIPHFQARLADFIAATDRFEPSRYQVPLAACA